MSSVQDSIPKGWVMTTLSEKAFINPRESIKKGEVKVNVPMTCIDSFTKKINLFERKKFKGGTKFRNGDTLLARITPCLENGKTAFVDILGNDEVGFGSTEYIVIREKENHSDKQFLYYLSISPFFREVAIRAMTGTSGRQRVQTDVLINKALAFPPLSEQKAIAKVLTTFDDKIENLRAQNQTLEQTAQTIFKEWFGKYQVDDELPEGWRVGKLSDICIIKNGYAFKSKDYVEDGVAVVRTTNFTDGTIDFSTNRIFLDRNEAQKYDRFYLEKFDILLVMVGASIGKNVITPSSVLPALQNQNMWNFKPINNSFLFYNIFSIRKIINQQINSASGSARDFFRKDYFYGLDIIIPSNGKLNDFEEMIKPYYLKIDNNLSQIQALKKTRDTLLPKLMSGKLRVNEFKD